MALIDKIVNELVKEKYDLLMSFEYKEISEKDYYIKYKIIKKKIDDRTLEVIDEYNKQKNLINNKQVNEMEEEKVNEELKEVPKKKETVARKIKKETLASFIEKALKMKTVNSVEAVVKKVQEWKPEKEESSIKRMTKNIIIQIKKQEQLRWKNYTWNQEEFLLIGPAEE